MLNHGATVRPGFAQEFEGEQASTRYCSRAGRDLEAAGREAVRRPEIRSDGPYVVPKTRNTLLMET